MQVPMSPVRILKRVVKLYPGKTAVVDGNLRRFKTDFKGAI